MNYGFNVPVNMDTATELFMRYTGTLLEMTLKFNVLNKFMECIENDRKGNKDIIIKRSVY